MSLTFFSFSFLGACNKTHCDSGNINLAIPDDGGIQYIYPSLTMSGVSGTVTSVRVQTFVEHPSSGELEIGLAFGSILVPLTLNQGDIRPNLFNGTIWDDAGLFSPGDYPFVYDVVVPVLQPDAFLSNFTGEAPNGEWYLVVADTSVGNTGRLLRWVLDVNCESLGFPPWLILVIFTKLNPI